MSGSLGAENAKRMQMPFPHRGWYLLPGLSRSCQLRLKKARANSYRTEAEKLIACRRAATESVAVFDRAQFSLCDSFCDPPHLPWCTVGESSRRKSPRTVPAVRLHTALGIQLT